MPKNSPPKKKPSVLLLLLRGACSCSSSPGQSVNRKRGGRTYFRRPGKNSNVESTSSQRRVNVESTSSHRSQRRVNVESTSSHRSQRRVAVEWAAFCSGIGGGVKSAHPQGPETIEEDRGAYKKAHVRSHTCKNTRMHMHTHTPTHPHTSESHRAKKHIAGPWPC